MRHREEKLRVHSRQLTARDKDRTNKTDKGAAQRKKMNVNS